MKNTESELLNYYSKNASSYDSLHMNSAHEHLLALHYVTALIRFNNIKRILDVGAGTGRVARFLAKEIPDIKVISVEPSVELREIAVKNGVNKNEIVEGNIYKLPYEDAEFDLVCAFGVFHHLEDPSLALSEMKRVSGKFLFFSDANNFGQGTLFMRYIKNFLRTIHMWNFFVFLKTKGKKYTITIEDGLAFSFSLVDITRDLKDYSLKFLSTRANNHNFLYTASHFALFAEKNNK